MERFVAGWDGGGTKTTVVCMTPDGRELARQSVGALNINGAPEREVAEHIREACGIVASVEGQCLGMAVATAGISNPRVGEVIESALRGAGYKGEYILRGDHVAALYGAVGGVGLVLTSGTGSICCGRNANGEDARCGGFGNIIDDGGSGYAIGRDILSAVVRALDGREAPTALTASVSALQKWRDIPTMLNTLYTERCDKSEVAALARLLPPALDAGDAAAVRIAERAADELALLITATARKLSMTSGRAAFTGSILENISVIREGVARRLNACLPDIIVSEPISDAAHGAALMALEAFGARG